MTCADRIDHVTVVLAAPRTAFVPVPVGAGAGGADGPGRAMGCRGHLVEAIRRSIAKRFVFESGRMLAGLPSARD